VVEECKQSHRGRYITIGQHVSFSNVPMGIWIPSDIRFAKRHLIWFNHSAVFAQLAHVPNRQTDTQTTLRVTSGAIECIYTLHAGDVTY